MNARNRYFLKLLPLFLIVFVMACNLPTGLLPTATPAAEATEGFSGPADFPATIAAAQTQAVDMAFQELTQNAQSDPDAAVTLRPSSTAGISATPLASFTPPPTVTPQPPATNTPVHPAVPIVVVTKAPSLTPTQGAFQCKVTSLNPAYGTRLTRGVDFDLRITLENAGTDTWEANDNDFRYISGAEFQTNRSVLDLKNDVDPGDEVTFVVDMAATTGTGVQSARWRFGDFCTVLISVYVIP